MVGVYSRPAAIQRRRRAFRSPTRFCLEAAEGGLIALVEDGDRIEINIPKRSIHLAVPEALLAERRAARQANGKTVPMSSA